MDNSKTDMVTLKEYLKMGVIGSITLGLAPFVPQPHILEKVKMLFAGTLSRPIDIFDLFFHGAPWIFTIVIVIKIAKLSYKKA